MARFRIGFAIVSGILVLVIGFLVARAIESVDVESRVRQETVAERIFDEMERALSRLVATEEERPFAGWLSETAPTPATLARLELDPYGIRVAPPGSVAAADVERTLRDLASGEKNRLAALSQRPGSTVEVDGKSGATQAEALGDRLGERPSAYDALRSLNKGVEQRAQRQTKLSQELVPPQTGMTEADGPIELSPLVGRRMDPHRLLLVRTARQSGRVTRQGLALDLAALGQWLARESLGSTDLAARATLDFGDAESSSREPGELVYQHRFAAPFESVTARLALAPLPGLGGGRWVYALSALSLLAVVLGLAALYRMTSVVLRYAEQRGNFVAAVTHELKTPLTAIRMYGEMLRDGIVPSEAKREEYYRHITAESERLTRLVNNVLEFSRLEKGSRHHVVLEAADLGATVREVAELVRPHVEGAGFALEVTLDPELPAVRFERDAVMQILFNLVDNAVKYADGASPKTIELRCRKEGPGVRLAVRDHGPGVPSRHLGRIFEPFYRAENELTRRTKGTGLGLALVRGLAERMGARVSGRNVADGGFEVDVEFR